MGIKSRMFRSTAHPSLQPLGCTLRGKEINQRRQVLWKIFSLKHGEAWVSRWKNFEEAEVRYFFTLYKILYGDGTQIQLWYDL